MKRRKALTILLGTLGFYIFVAILTTGCGSVESPAAPSSIPAPIELEPAQTALEPTAPAEERKFEDKPDTTAGWINWSSDGEFAFGDVSSGLGKAEDFGLCAYFGDMGDLENQHLSGPGQVKRIAPGRDATLSATLACEVDNQVDFVYDIGKCPKTPPPKSKTIAARIIKGGPCPPPSPECVPRECPGPNWIFDRSVCDCIWLCNVITEPECPDQIWDPRTCTWIGECPQ